MAKYSVTVKLDGEIKGTFEVEESTEGRARSRAALKAMRHGVSVSGGEISYDVKPITETAPEMTPEQRSAAIIARAKANSAAWNKSQGNKRRNYRKSPLLPGELHVAAQQLGFTE